MDFNRLLAVKMTPKILFATVVVIVAGAVVLTPPSTQVRVIFKPTYL